MDACPSPRLLEQLVLGQLPGPEAEALAAHVGSCPHCAGTFSKAPEPLEAQTSPDVVHVLMRQLKRLLAQTTVTHLGQPTPSGAAACDFLDPPRGPDELGWLGPYRVRKLLGTGGMGVVFLAEDPRLKRQIALKVIKPELLPRDDMRGRFLREAQTVAAVEHENIIAVFEVNEHNGVPYLVMPLLRGESLDERLRRANGPVPVEEVLRVGKEIAAGLAAAHAQGMIHRDIKPANVFVTEGGRLKVLDFGLARAVSGEDSGLSQSGAIVGTPAYMAPEQAAGGVIDGRADLFSLGCVLYVLATGKQPFEAGDIYSTLIRIATEDPVPAAKVNPRVPGEVSRLLDRLMAKTAADRPASAEEVVRLLTRLEQGRARRTRRLWLAVAAVALVLTGGLVPFLVGPPRKPESAKVEPPRTTPVLVSEEHGEGSVWAVACSPVEPVVLSASQDQTVGWWDLTGKAKTLARLPVPVRAVAVRPDGKLAALAGGGLRPPPDWGIRLWNLAARREVGQLVGHDSFVQTLAFSPGGTKLASGGREGIAYIWDVETRKNVPLAANDNEGVYGVAFTADGNRVLTAGGDGRLIVWDVATGRRSQVLTDHGKEGLRALAVAGDRAVTADEAGTVRVWDTATWTSRLLGKYERPVLCAAWTPDGRRVLWGADDGALRLWDAADGGEVLRFAGPKAAVQGVACTADGRLAVTGGQDGVVRVWELPR